MKLIIAGGRDYKCTNADMEALDSLLLATPIEEVICGNATGADCRRGVQFGGNVTGLGACERADGGSGGGAGVFTANKAKED